MGTLSPLLFYSYFLLTSCGFPVSCDGAHHRDHYRHCTCFLRVTANFVTVSPGNHLNNCAQSFNPLGSRQEVFIKKFSSGTFFLSSTTTSSSSTLLLASHHLLLPAAASEHSLQLPLIIPRSLSASQAHFLNIICRSRASPFAPASQCLSPTMFRLAQRHPHFSLCSLASPV